jgi:hypothetical protein
VSPRLLKALSDPAGQCVGVLVHFLAHVGLLLSACSPRHRRDDPVS